jgi:hypothetical protein
MPFILQNGQLILVSDEEYQRFTQGGDGAVPAGGENINITGQQIIDPNTANNTPGQTLTAVNEPLIVSPEDAPVPVEEDGEAILLNRDPAPVPGNQTFQYPIGPGGQTPYDDDGNINPGWTLSEDGNPVFVGGGFVEPSTAQSAAASRQQALTNQLRQQSTIQAQRKQANNGDWRVKLRLAESADYLYKDPELRDNGILWPLNITGGVVFPYTPQITTTYHANYNAYDLTHSNSRGYFYQNSYVGEVQLNASFTAQDTSEANYLLAVIHFFRSVTKMFYGKDSQRGAPPPLVFLQGLGEYQFNLHPCVVQTFNYNLPADVDYIRARSVSQANTSNLLFRRAKQTLPTNPFSSAIERLRNAGLRKGALNNVPPAPPTFGIDKPTYVPTKLDMTLILLPVQTRQQMSQQFSLKGYANGDLLKGGFW